MPCYMTGSREGDLELSLDEQAANITTLSEMLCFLCKRIEDTEQTYLFNSQISSWWKMHKLIDKKREQREKKNRELQTIKNKALAKLSHKERQALGL